MVSPVPVEGDGVEGTKSHEVGVVAGDWKTVISQIESELRR